MSVAILSAEYEAVKVGRGTRMPKNDRNFGKSDASEAEPGFWRPCRGLSPGKGFAPNKMNVKVVMCTLKS